MASAILEKPVMTNPNSPNRKFPLERTRNIGIAAHIDAGKTTLTDVGRHDLRLDAESAVRRLQDV